MDMSRFLRSLFLRLLSCMQMLTSSYQAQASHSLLKLEPSTGRKHQLRVHCAELLDASIVGDYKYGPKVDHRSLWKELPNDEILLHSFKVSFHVSSFPPSSFKEVGLPIASNDN